MPALLNKRTGGGVPSKAMTVRISPEVVSRLERYQKLEYKTQNFAVECLLIRGLDAFDNDNKESEVFRNAEPTETNPQTQPQA